jgi:DNA primase
MPLSDLNYLLFLKKSGLDVKLIFVSEQLEFLQPIKNHYGFFQNHPCIWMIPISTPNKKILGFILRGYENKEYRIIFNHDGVSPMYGWEDFKNYNEEPIILTEGMKDAIWIKQYYPYVLSLNTSNITQSNLEILKKVTNKLLLIYDNDETGIPSVKKDVKMLSEYNFNCDYILPDGKDCAEYFEKNIDSYTFLNNMDFKLKKLGGKLCRN